MNSQPITFHHAPKSTSLQLRDNSIVLCTLNARYIHSSLGLRYLYANMGSLQSATRIVEFVISQRTNDIAERLLELDPEIIGFGVYIWNIQQTTALISLIKNIKPEIKIVIGGPEVSYEYIDTNIYHLCDHLITGQADLAFSQVCNQLLQTAAPPKVIDAQVPDINQLELPYSFYNSEDIAYRVMYVEASRGCPFKCEFCLSALDKTAKSFELEQFLYEMEQLYNRGTRRFKFVDRTFNLKLSHCTRILQFFLDRINDDRSLFLHFEVIPDKLPDALKHLIQQFPEGSLQFEIGIQSFNPEVQQTINRRQNIEKTVQNIEWLRKHSNAHIHADLIFGLPGETLESFADGFNQLAKLEPHEIQLGLLKRLRGSPIVERSNQYAMRFENVAPYQLLQNSTVDFATMQRVQRFARYWDLIANSGRFKFTLPLLLGDDPFDRFMRLSDWVYKFSQQTHKINYQRLLGLVHRGATEIGLCAVEPMYDALAADSFANGYKHPPEWISKRQQPPMKERIVELEPNDSSADEKSSIPARQKRHLSRNSQQLPAQADST